MSLDVVKREVQRQGATTSFKSMSAISIVRGEEFIREVVFHVGELSPHLMRRPLALSGPRDSPMYLSYILSYIMGIVRLIRESEQTSTIVFSS